MEQRPSLEQIEDVIERCRIVLGLAARNNRGIAGRKLDATNAGVFFAGLEIGSCVADLIIALRGWGMQSKGDSFEGIGCGDLLAAQCVLLQRSQEILDTYGLRPAKLFGTNAGTVNLTNGDWPAIPESCIQDVEFWKTRIESVAMQLRQPEEEPAAGGGGGGDGNANEPMWDGAPVRCYFDQEDMTRSPLIPAFIEQPSTFGLSRSTISKAWRSGELTKRMPLRRGGQPFAFLFKEVSALSQRKQGYSED